MLIWLWVGFDLACISDCHDRERIDVISFDIDTLRESVIWVFPRLRELYVSWVFVLF